MTEEEKALFDELILMRNPFTVKKIVDDEHSRIASGLPPKINLLAIDENGKGFAHYAAKWGNRNVIDIIVVDLRAGIFQDGVGYFPQDYYSLPYMAFPNAMGRRKYIEQEEKQYANYNSYLQRVLAVEKEVRAYASGIIFTNNFALCYGAKPNKLHKSCHIPDVMDSETKLTTHQVQAIKEVFVAHKPAGASTMTINELLNAPKKLEAVNYLLVNIGCVITDRSHVKNGDHKRIFITAPLNVPAANGKYLSDKPHSEAFLVDKYFCDENGIAEKRVQDAINGLLDANEIKHTVKTPRKIYSLVFDMHSSQDVCDGCECRIFNFQRNFTAAVKRVIKNMGFHVPKDESDSFRMVFRISSSRLPSHSDYRTPFHKREQRKPDEFARKYTHQMPMDLRRSAMPLILHSDDKMREELAKWYETDNYKGLTLFGFSSATVFQNQIGMYNRTLPSSVFPVKAVIADVIPNFHGQERILGDVVECAVYQFK